MSAFVNEQDAYGSGFGSSLATAGISHSAGNLLALIVIWEQDASFPSDISSISNTAGDTFVSAAARSTGWSVNIFGQVWYVASTAGNASDAITVNFSGSFGAKERRIVVVQLSGMDSTPVMGVNSSSATNASATTGTITVTSAGFIVAAGRNDFDTWATGTGYTGAAFASTTNSLYEYKAVSASEAAIATCANANWFLIGASFKNAAAGSAALAPRPRLIGQGINRASTF